MPVCIFCLEDKPSSREHVIPAALGGRIELKNCVCEDDNNLFSEEFETKLFRELVPLRLLLQIQDRDGDIPTSDVTVKIEDKDYRGRIKDGTVEMRPVIEKIVMPDGAIELSGKYLTEAIKANWAKGIAEGKYSAVGTEAKGQAVEEGEVHLGGDLELGSSIEGLRNAAKIAFLTLVLKFGSKIAMSEGFNDIRRFILTGEGQGIVRLFVLDRFAEAVQLGPHQHALILAARKAERRIDAIVRIFGNMCYLVKLSSNYDGADFYLTFVYDALRGEENGALQTVLNAEFLQIQDVLHSPDTVWDNRVLWGERFIGYLEQEVKNLAVRKAAKLEPPSQP